LGRRIDDGEDEEEETREEEDVEELDDASFVGIAGASTICTDSSVVVVVSGRWNDELSSLSSSTMSSL
jgi:hypothetical protein